jgi:hypothetical protein
LVFLTPINSQLKDFLNEVHQIACLERSIVERSRPASQKEKSCCGWLMPNIWPVRLLTCPSCTAIAGTKA